jgi:hypothetical protein
MAILIKRGSAPEPPKPESATVNQSAILGEPGTGYEGPDGKGEFECENCSFFDEDTVSCGQADMVAKSKRPKIENGRVVVHPEGCCEYVKRIGKTEADDD